MKKLWVMMAFAGILIFAMGGIADADVMFDIGPNNSPASGTSSSPTGNYWQLGTGWGPSSANLLDATFGLNTSLPSVSFSLNAGQTSDPFIFGTITFNEGSIETSEMDNLGVTAYLNFVLPPVGQEPSTSTVTPIQGDSHDATGYFQWQRINGQWVQVWIPGNAEQTDLTITFNPKQVTFSGGTFTIQLSTVEFTDEDQTKNVYATVTLDSVNSVPEPITMVMLGSGLVGLWGFRKKFRK